MNRRRLLILVLVVLFLASTLLYANDSHYKQRKIFTVKGVTFYMLYVPPGTFMMGSPVKEKGHKAEEIQHEATITSGFWIGRTEVAQKLYQAVREVLDVRIAIMYPLITGAPQWGFA